jgi:hypothetical protein
MPRRSWRRMRVERGASTACSNVQIRIYRGNGPNGSSHSALALSTVAIPERYPWTAV